MVKGTYALSTNATRLCQSSTNSTRSCRSSTNATPSWPSAHLRHLSTRQKKVANYALASTMNPGSRGLAIRRCTSPNLLMWSTFRPRAEASRLGASKVGTRMSFTLMWLLQDVLENALGEVNLTLSQICEAQAVLVILHIVWC